MSRYYILTEHNGVAIVEAPAMDQHDPAGIGFVLESKIDSSDRDKLLWWSSVESQPAPPYSSFGRVEPVDPFGHLPTQHQFSVQGGPLRNTDQQLNRHDRHLAARRALVAAASAAIPHGWKKAMLELKVTYALPEARYKVAHRLLDPDTQVEAFDFSDGLFAAVDVFHRIAIEDGNNWNRSTMILNLTGQGIWTATNANYEYGTNFGPR
jgi:hypothetical protein